VQHGSPHGNASRGEKWGGGGPTGLLTLVFIFGNNNCICVYIDIICMRFEFLFIGGLTMTSSAASTRNVSEFRAIMVKVILQLQIYCGECSKRKPCVYLQINIIAVGAKNAYQYFRRLTRCINLRLFDCYNKSRVSNM